MVSNKGQRPSKVTIADVAKLAGVGVGTVSRVINGKEGIREETQQKVLSAIRELNFVPSAAARSIKGGAQRNANKASRSVGVILNVSTRNDPYFYHILNGVEDELANHGINCIFSQIREPSVQGEPGVGLDSNISRLLFEGNLDGIIVVGGSSSTARVFGKTGLPVVIIDQYDFKDDFKDDNCDYVLADNIQGARKAISYLISLGHEKIAYVKCGDNWFFNELEEGYKHALYEAGIPFSPELILSAEDSFDAGLPLVTKLVEKKHLPSAFFTNDRVSIGILNALVTLGYRVPEEISVHGFDDIDAASYSNPPLTTIQVPKREMGMMASRRIIEQLDRETRLPPVKTTLSTRLIVRKSTAVNPKK